MSNTETPLILSMDTSVGPCSVALFRGDTMLACKKVEDFHQQSKQLVLLCEHALKDANLSYSDLQMVASTVGPGSFTSIRVGMSVAKAISFGVGIPYYGCSSLNILASPHFGSNTPILSVIDAHRNEVYVQAFGTNSEAYSDGIVTSISQIPSITGDISFTITGTAHEKLKAELPDWSVRQKWSDTTYPDASLVAKYVMHHHKDTNTHFTASPIYIRPPDAKLPSKPFLSY